MAHYFGAVKGRRNEATRLGSRKSGLCTVAASWQGAVEVCLYDNAGRTHALVRLIPWHGTGVDRLLYDGPVDSVGGDHE